MKIKQQQTIVEFDIQDLLPIGITIGILGVALSYFGSLQEATRDAQVTDNGAATATCNLSIHRFDGCGMVVNISRYALTGTNKLASNIPLIVGAIVIAVVIGILLRYFVFGQGR
jgi:hypothetical protein